MSMSRDQYGHPRERGYSEAELALFAQYTPVRAGHQPAACDQGEGCWVFLGPPAFSSVGHGTCLRCNGAPR